MNLDYRSIISNESSRLIEIISDGPLHSPVRGTPGWDLAGLGAHLVDVQTWATHIIINGEPSESAPPTPGPGNEAEALTHSSTQLLAALDAANPEDPCWNFTKAQQTKAFWFRRQALEVAVHRWDAESAVTPEPADLTPEVAADVIDEYLGHMLQRVGDREGLDLSIMTDPICIQCTDSDRIGNQSDWTIEMADGQVIVSDQRQAASATLQAPAAAIALFLYNRIPEHAVSIVGDRAALDPWSALFGL